MREAAREGKDFLKARARAVIPAKAEVTLHEGR